MHLDPKCNCKQTHKVTKVCVSPQCKIPNPFASPDCRKTGHDTSCQFISYKNLINKFHKVQGIYNTTFLKYQERVQSLFQDLMGRLQKQFINFRQQFQYYNITPAIQNIYKMIKQKRQQKVTAYQINVALKQQPIAFQQYSFKNQLQLKILRKQILQDHFNQVIQKLPKYYNLYQAIKQDQENLEDYQQNKLKYIKQKYDIHKKGKGYGLLDECYNQFQKMIGRQIFSVQSLYIASKHQFSAQKFHERCDKISNTVTMIKTQYGNIVGGFCPFAWRSPTNWQYVEDVNKQAFLFSLDKQLRKIKMKVVDHRQRFAIGMHKQYGPCFGDDLVIYDKANNSKSCWSNFPDVYCGSKDNKYLAHTAETLKSFVGTQQHYQKFNIIEWEVYKINFSRSQQVQQSFMKQYRQI